MNTSRSHALELPHPEPDGPDKVVTVVLDEPHLKVMFVALRNGAHLPSHAADAPITIHVLDGEGVIEIGTEPMQVSTGSFLSLTPGEKHSVTPSEGKQLALLVHNVRAARPEKE